VIALFIIFIYRVKIILMKKLLLLVGLVVFLIVPLLVKANNFEPKQLVGKTFQTKESYMAHCSPNKDSKYIISVYPKSKQKHFEIQVLGFKKKWANVAFYKNDWRKIKGNFKSCKNKGRSFYINNESITKLLNDNENDVKLTKQLIEEIKLVENKKFKKTKNIKTLEKLNFSEYKDKARLIKGCPNEQMINKLDGVYKGINNQNEIYACIINNKITMFGSIENIKLRSRTTNFFEAIFAKGKVKKSGKFKLFQKYYGAIIEGEIKKDKMKLTKIFDVAVSGTILKSRSIVNEKLAKISRANENQNQNNSSNSNNKTNNSFDQKWGDIPNEYQSGFDNFVDDWGYKYIQTW